MSDNAASRSSVNDNAGSPEGAERDATWDETRCRVCGWPLAAERKDGCVAGDCSMRPVPKVRADARVAPDGVCEPVAWLCRWNFDRGRKSQPYIEREDAERCCRNVSAYQVGVTGAHVVPLYLAKQIVPAAAPKVDEGERVEGNVWDSAEGLCFYPTDGSPPAAPGHRRATLILHPGEPR